MLPYFQIITNNNKEIGMYVPEVPAKPKRNKKPDVPVHKNDRAERKSVPEKKTYAANFNSKKSKIKADIVEQSFREKDIEASEDLDEGKLNARLGRKHLVKENERLTVENQELAEKLCHIEDYLTKKNCKLKEKVQTLQSINDEVLTENTALREKCNDLEIKLRQTYADLEYAKNCAKCEELNKLIEQSKIDTVLHKKTNYEMTEDINMLKNVVYRLNVQLERYQEKLTRHNIRIHPYKDKHFMRSENVDTLETISNENYIKNSLSESHWDHSHTPISWGKVNAHTLGPLLDAYQETLKEKDEIIQDYEAELAKFTGRLKDVIKENELLHKRLTEDGSCSRVLNEQIQSLNQELKSTKEQNDLLIKKCSLKQDKIEEILKCYETRVEQMKRDYTVLHEQYCKSRTEVAALKEKNRSLLEVQDDFKNERHKYIPISVHKSSVEECKKWYEELKIQYEAEKRKLTDNLEQLNVQIKDLSNKISSLNAEKTELENKTKAFEKQIKKSEGKYLDLQHTLNEVQLSRSACRKQLHKAMTFAKDLVAEQEALLKALNQRNLENKAVTRLGSDIANRMDSLKNQLKMVQKDAFEELTSVEHRLQEQDSLISNLKQEHQEEVERLKQIIKGKEENLLLRDNVSSIPIPNYLLFKEKSLHR